jgi:predicted DNA-binding protein (MmcQ/YjbR family)
MKAWSAALTTELATLHEISTRSMFGLTAIYRGDRIFAALPSTRGMNTANSFGFKLETPASRVLTRLQRDARISASEMAKARWFTFEITSDADLRAALDWLNQAYEAAK